MNGGLVCSDWMLYYIYERTWDVKYTNTAWRTACHIWRRRQPDSNLALLRFFPCHPALYVQPPFTPVAPMQSGLYKWVLTRNAKVFGEQVNHSWCRRYLVLRRRDLFPLEHWQIVPNSLVEEFWQSVVWLWADLKNIWWAAKVVCSCLDSRWLMWCCAETAHYCSPYTQYGRSYQAPRRALQTVRQFLRHC